MLRWCVACGPWCACCSSWTKRLITAKDHASVQINVGKVDPATGTYTGEFQSYALCGFVRGKVRIAAGCGTGSGRLACRPHAFLTIGTVVLVGLQGEADLAITTLLAQSEGRD